MKNASPILPVGMVNLKTGEFEYGNIYGFWGEDTTYEVYAKKNGKIEVVATAGSEPIVPVDGYNDFIHDQTGEWLFDGDVIETVTGDVALKTLMKYGESISMHTYK